MSFDGRLVILRRRFRFCFLVRGEFFGGRGVLFIFGIFFYLLSIKYLGGRKRKGGRGREEGEEAAARFLVSFGVFVLGVVRR